MASLPVLGVSSFPSQSISHSSRLHKRIQFQPKHLFFKTPNQKRLSKIRADLSGNISPLTSTTSGSDEKSREIGADSSGNVTNTSDEKSRDTRADSSGNVPPLTSGKKSFPEKKNRDIRADNVSTPSSSTKKSCDEKKKASCDEKIRDILQDSNYKEKYEFRADIDSHTIPKGLSKETIIEISSIKEEPDWMLEFRLNAFDKFLKMKEPKWSDNHYPTIDFQNISYYSAPKKKISTSSTTLNSLDEADPELVKLFEKLGVPLDERNRRAIVAFDVVLDSASVATTFSKTLKEELGVIFCSISEAVKEYPDLVKKSIGRVVPSEDNYYSALNSAVFSDGTFIYIPKDTKCSMPLTTYFRINAVETGQFERTLIVAEDRSFVEYYEGCSAPVNHKNQLHAAVVELYCGEGAQIKYSTLQTWYAGDEDGNGGIYNFVTKRGLCAGAGSRISWSQVETGSAITWKYPSVVLEGDDSVGEFYSLAVTNNYQQADTGTKMIHKGKNTKSRIISKGISAGNSRNCYRGLVQIHSKADNAKNSSQCDSMLIGDLAVANTYPRFQVKKPSAAHVEHEASTSQIGVDKLFYFQQRGVDIEKAMVAMISGFCRDVFNEFPAELGADANIITSMKLEGSVG